MAVARVMEIIASSPKGFDEAVKVGVKRTCKTLNNVKGAWVKSQKCVVEDGKITEYRANLDVTFILK